MFYNKKVHKYAKLFYQIKTAIHVISRENAVHNTYTVQIVADQRA